MLGSLTPAFRCPVSLSSWQICTSDSYTHAIKFLVFLQGFYPVKLFISTSLRTQEIQQILLEKCSSSYYLFFFYSVDKCAGLVTLLPALSMYVNIPSISMIHGQPFTITSSSDWNLRNSLIKSERSRSQKLLPDPFCIFFGWAPWYLH